MKLVTAYVFPFQNKYNLMLSKIASQPNVWSGSDSYFAFLPPKYLSASKEFWQFTHKLFITILGARLALLDPITYLYITKFDIIHAGLAHPMVIGDHILDNGKNTLVNFLNKKKIA